MSGARLPLWAASEGNHIMALGVNVKSFGAVGDGVTDDAPAIQAAIDHVEARITGGCVLFPSAVYAVGSPLRIRSHGIALQGEQAGQFGEGTTLKASGFSGPLVHITPGAETRASLTLVPSLVSGPGQALAFNPATMHSDTYLDLQDSAAYVLGGLSACTVECFLRMDAPPANFTTTALSLTGRLCQGDAIQTTLDLRVIQGGRIQGILSVNGQAIVVDSQNDAVEVGVVYHVALVYNGATVTLWIGRPGQPSVAFASASASGPITTFNYQMGNLGSGRVTWPTGGVYLSPFTGAIDGLRISRTARYTTAFTVPAQKPVFDSDTLLLDVFDDETIDWSVVETAIGTTYLPKYFPFAGHILVNIALRNLELQAGQGMGVWSRCAIETTYEDLSIWGGVYGFKLWSNNFLNRFSRVHVSGNATTRVCLLNTWASGIVHYDNLTLTAGDIGLLWGSGSGSIQTAFFHGTQRYSMVLTDGVYALASVFFSNEDADPARFVTNLLLSRNPSVTMTACSLERYASPGPAIRVDGGGSLVLAGPVAEMHTEAASVIDVTTATENTIEIIAGSFGRSNFPRNIPWIG